jgi:26S proteasome regulatory subunit N8
MFNLLPNLNVPSTVASFSIKTNDELLVIYLSSLIRAVIALHNLIENKVILRNHESDDLKDKGEDKVAGASGGVKVAS